jgi:endonuclease YncB( thermonuclease family)
MLLAHVALTSSCVSGDLVTTQLFADARSRQERRGVPSPTATPTPVPPTSTPTATRSPAPGRVFAKVLRAWDGNTVLIEGGYSVRYIGVAAPGAGMFRRPVEPFGREAAERNIELVEGKEVELEADAVDVDAAGNMLRYVYVGGTMVNELLLREGLARLAPFGRNTRHSGQLVQAELDARRTPLAIWTLVTLTPTPSNTPTITPTPSPTFTPSLTPVPTTTPPETPTPRPSATPRVTTIPAQRTPNLTPAVPITLVPVPPQPAAPPGG